MTVSARVDGVKDLLGALRHPETLPALSLRDWELLVRQARLARLLGRIAVALGERGLRAKIPTPVQAHLEVAQMFALENAHRLRWEVHRVKRALASTASPIILLKGAAYVMRDLPIASGRLSSDIDIMVPKEKLAAVEAALLRHGWEAVDLDAYDQRYYRTWMHELPPLRHRDRRTVIDVHHTILPESGRLHPDPRLLFENALDLDGVRLKTLAPPHMVLHAAVHLFQDGDLTGGLAQILDLHSLLSHFGTEARFWNDLVRSSQQLHLQRPLFYALRYTERLFGTVVPPGTAGLITTRPPRFVAIMDRLVTSALCSPYTVRPPVATAMSLWLLYVRSHWLRMPPLLLAHHLLRKSLRRYLPR